MSKICRMIVAIAIVASFAMVFTSCSLKTTKRDIHTLIMVSNYQQPKLIADLIQYENAQPYLLLPNQLDKRTFFVPNSNSPQPEPVEIQESDIPAFLSTMHPTQIVIIGDERYVPAKYERMIPANVTRTRVSNRNWQEVANTCQTILRLNNLASDFRDKSYELLIRHDPNVGDAYKAADASVSTLNTSEPTVRQAPAPKVRVIEEITETDIVPPPVPVEEDPNFVVPK